MHHPTERITHTTAFVTPVVEHWLEREIAEMGMMWLVTDLPSILKVKFFLNSCNVGRKWGGGGEGPFYLCKVSFLSD